MEESAWIEKLRKHLAIASVGNSTLMKQSGKGRIDRAQKYLIKNMNLSNISDYDDLEFKIYLDTKTILLAKQLLRPVDNKPNWGAARKVINIYFRMCSMNKDLNKYYRLNKIEPYLEVPLDNHIVKEIDREAKTEFSKTFRILTLTKKENKLIQDIASSIAMSIGIYRYEMDVLFWNYKKLNA